MPFDELKKGADQKKRKPPRSYWSLSLIILRGALVLGLIFWLLWLFHGRVSAPQPQAPPPPTSPENITFSEPDALPMP